MLRLFDPGRYQYLRRRDLVLMVRDARASLEPVAYAQALDLYRHTVKQVYAPGIDLKLKLLVDCLVEGCYGA